MIYVGTNQHFLQMLSLNLGSDFQLFHFDPVTLTLD